LDAYLADRRYGKRLAIAFTGGGARGAWEAGVVEALTTACRSREIAIDIVVGTSVGSINALCTFVDALAPSATPVDGVFSARQSHFWKRYASGNQGADQLLDRSWIIPYLTNQMAIPGKGVFSDGERHLQQAWDAAGGQLSAIGRAAAQVKRAGTTPPRGLTEETGLAVRQLSTDIDALRRHARRLESDWNNLHSLTCSLAP
jgi:predicted acylesterase/phospholipase RssA